MSWWIFHNGNTSNLQEKFDIAELATLGEEIGKLGLNDTLQKYYSKPVEKEARSIVAGPSFLQFLNKLFQTQISAGDVIQFESGDSIKYYMLSTTGTWDKIIKLQ